MIIIPYINSNVNIPYNTPIIASAGSSNDNGMHIAEIRVNCKIGMNLK